MATPSTSLLLDGQTVRTRMITTGGRTSGFDYLRILLAISVVLVHSRALTIGIQHHVQADLGAGSPVILHPPLGQPLVWAILPSFFALSGFLVAGSLMRSKTTAEFVLLRVLRIIPALFVETVLAAFILGPLVTEFSLRDYFTDPEFLSYPLNIIGIMHYTLPGVFLHNPVPRMVNAQLWTIPAEFFCYLTLVIVSVTGLVKIRSAIPLLTIALTLIFSVNGYLAPETLGRWSAGASRADLNTLWLSFLFGVTIFIWQHKLPLNRWLFALSVVLTYALLYDGAFQYFAAVPVAYATVYVGLMTIRKSPITLISDYSYGVYLYGAPVQQLMVFLFPRNQFFILNFIGGLSFALVLAALSWHFVEFKVLDHRKMVISYVNARIDRANAWMRQALNLPSAPGASGLRASGLDGSFKERTTSLAGGSSAEPLGSQAMANSADS